MTEWVIECEGLTKDYGRKRAVWDLNLRVPKGCVTGLLGRNGCGKTTTIKLLLGLVEPTRGAARVLGHPSTDLPEDVRERVGYLIEGHPLYRSWRIRQLESFTRAFYRRWDTQLFAKVLSRSELDPAQRVWSLSRGQRGMVALALVLASEPELLILDDPAIGLDPVVRRTFLEAVIQMIHAEGRTILFASHHLADVDRVADRIVILEKGVLRVDCAVHEFMERVRRVSFDVKGDAPALEDFPGLLECDVRGSSATLTIANFDDEKRDRLRRLVADGFQEIPLNLEDAFISYAGRRFSKGE
ncbi:MAG: ABC transporter ATP-binding protein [Planctomycetes bacterium]|nr:ABC transporter ATP-binding protein [Planctomycetota bacterium]